MHGFWRPLTLRKSALLCTIAGLEDMFANMAFCLRLAKTPKSEIETA